MGFGLSEVVADENGVDVALRKHVQDLFVLAAEVVGDQHRVVFLAPLNVRGVGALLRWCAGITDRVRVESESVQRRSNRRRQTFINEKWLQATQSPPTRG